MTFWERGHAPKNALAFVDEHGRQVTRGELDDRVDEAASALRSRAPRSLGFIICRNDAQTVATYLAFLRSGHVPLLLPHALAPELRSRLVAQYEPDAIFGEGDAHLPGSGMPYEWRREPGSDALHPDLALLLSTSGSTGSPRLVRLSARSVAANAQAIAQYLALGAREIAVTSLPCHYSYGLSVVNSHLHAGGALVLTEASVVQEEFWAACERHAVTSLAGVPYTYQLLHRIDLARRAPSTLRTLTQAGGALGERLTRYFGELAAARRWRFFVMYGQTEATARISYLPPEMLPHKPGSIGIAIPGGSLRVDPGSGELLYQGPNVMMGYATQRSDLSRGDELLGHLATGELAYADEDGFFFLRGRLKRFVKLSGHRLALDELEQQLESSLGAPVAVGGADDRLRVVVESANEDIVLRAAAILKERFSLHHSLFRITVVPGLPLLPSGKKDYQALEAIA